MRTVAEIELEIQALEALKPVGPFKRKCEAIIKAAIDELTFVVEPEQLREMSDEERDIVDVANAWRSGHSETKPSEGWGTLVG